MNLFNRAFVSLLAIGLAAGLIAGLVLVWAPERVVDASGDGWMFQVDINLERTSDQILATIAIGAFLMVSAFLLFGEMMPWGGTRKVESRYGDAEYRRLEQRVDSLSARPRDREVVREERVEGQGPRWNFLHRGHT